MQNECFFLHRTTAAAAAQGVFGLLLLSTSGGLFEIPNR